MKMFGLFDSYELRARIFPAIIVFLPAWVTGVVLGQWGGGNVVSLTLGTTTAVPVLYLGGMLVRQLGRSIEGKLWLSWDGPPSTRILRWRDPTLAAAQKSRLHQAIRESCGIVLASPEAEAKDDSSADKLIEQAFREIRTTLRQKDRASLLNIHNAEYGFCRNLLGARLWWVTISLAGSATCGSMSWVFGSHVLLAGLVMNLGMLAASLYLGWIQLLQMAKAAADRYAETAISSYLAIVEVAARRRRA